MDNKEVKVNFNMEGALEELLAKLRENISFDMGIILRESFGYGKYESVRDALNGFDGTSKRNGQGIRLPVNVYPGGIPTKNIYEEFLCVCAGKTTLGQALRKILAYCNAAEKALPIEKEKTVVLLTDKWSARCFDRYKAELMDFTQNENIRIYVFLATEFTFNEIRLLELQNVGVDPAMNFFQGSRSRYLICLERIGKVMYFKHDDFKYKIDLANKKMWLDGRLVCRYIPRKAILDFCMFTKNFLSYESTGLDELSQSGDYVLTTKRYSFSYTLIIGEQSNNWEEALGLHDALMDLFRSVGLADEHNLIYPDEEEA